jgi:CheY-like chemotaxis protein
MPVSFLLVEDDDVDAEAFRRVLRKKQVDASLDLAKDGSEALQMLRERVHRTGDLIVFLDLNMPGMNGHEFLSELRSDAELNKTIVFVLTSSDHERDIRMAYDQNVAGYFLKSDVNSLIATISHYIGGVSYPPQII